MVLSASSREVSLLPFTNALGRHRHPHLHVELMDLRDAGVTRPCGVRRSVVAIDRLELLTLVGRLSKFGLERVLSRPSKVVAA